MTDSELAPFYVMIGCLTAEEKAYEFWLRSITDQNETVLVQRMLEERNSGEIWPLRGTEQEVAVEKENALAAAKRFIMEWMFREEDPVNTDEVLARTAHIMNRILRTGTENESSVKQVMKFCRDLRKKFELIR